MRDRVGIVNRINGSRNAVTATFFTFESDNSEYNTTYHGKNFLPSNVKTNEIGISEIQLLERTATTFKMKIKRNDVDFSHVRLNMSTDAEQLNSMYYEVTGFKYLGGGKQGIGDTGEIEGFIEVSCKFDPYINLKDVRFSGVQTMVKGGSHQVLNSPYETTRRRSKIDIESFGLMFAAHRLVLKIVPKFELLKTNMEPNSKWTTEHNGSFTPSQGINVTIGRIISIETVAGMYNFSEVLANILDDLDTAYTVVDAWVTPYMTNTNTTFSYAGMTFLEHNTTPPRRDQTRTFEQTYNVNSDIASSWHKGGVGLGYGETEQVIPFKNIGIGLNTRGFNEAPYVKVFISYVPSTSSGTPSKFLLILDDETEKVIASVDIPVLPFPLIDAPLQRHDKEGHFEQAVEVTDLLITAIGSAITSPKLSKGIFDSAMNLLTAGAYIIARRADMAAQPITLSNGTGGLEVTVGDVYFVTDLVSLFPFAARDPQSHLNYLRSRQVEVQALNRVENVSYNDDTFRLNRYGVNSNGEVDSDLGEDFFIKGDFSVKVKDPFTMSNKIMLDEISDVLKNGVTFYETKENTSMIVEPITTPLSPPYNEQEPTDPPFGDVNNPYSVTITEHTQDMIVGETFKSVAIVKSSMVANVDQDITWTTDGEFTTVDEFGNVTAIAAGSEFVYAHSTAQPMYSDFTGVTVSDIPVYIGGPPILSRQVTNDSEEVTILGPVDETVEITIDYITYFGTVDENGVTVIAIPKQTVGTTIEIVLIAANGTRSETLTISVASAIPPEINAVNSTDVLIVGQTFQLSVEITPLELDQSVEWFSHNTSVTVDQTGYVTAAQSGTAIIEAMSIYDNSLLHTFVIDVYSPLIIPAMSSFNTPTPFIASASSNVNSSYLPFKGFDSTVDSPTGGWLSANSPSASWLKIDVGNPKAINRYSILRNSNLDVSMDCKSWRLEGSDNNTSWTILDTQTNILFDTYNTVSTKFTLPQTAVYRYYRLYITASRSSTTNVGLAELDLYHT